MIDLEQKIETGLLNNGVLEKRLIWKIGHELYKKEKEIDYNAILEEKFFERIGNKVINFLKIKYNEPIKAKIENKIEFVTSSIGTKPGPDYVVNLIQMSKNPGLIKMYKQKSTLHERKYIVENLIESYELLINQIGEKLPSNETVNNSSDGLINQSSYEDEWKRLENAHLKGFFTSEDDKLRNTQYKIKCEVDRLTLDKKGIENQMELAKSTLKKLIDAYVCVSYVKK